MNQSIRQLGRATLVSLLFLGICGCGDGDRPEVVPVSGVVTLEGKPLTTGSVMFQPAKGHHARALIQPDGSFVMTTFNEGDGATVGTQMVRVASSEKQKVDKDGEELLGATLIPKAYGNFGTSGLTVDVPAGGTDSIVIDLKKRLK